MPVTFLVKHFYHANNYGMDTTNIITVPPPEEIERRIIACKAELKALARIKRLSRAAKAAAEAAKSRVTPHAPKDGAE